MNRLLAGLLLAAGILIAGASGLCSAVVGFNVFFQPGPPGLVSFFVIMMLIFGGIPFCGGVTMIWAALRLLRREREGPDHQDVF